MNKKILNNSQIIKKISFYKGKKKTIGLCHGVFDIIHAGHIKHFRYAKKMCDFLVVSITKDIYIKKGPNRPYFNEKLRVETLSELSSINAVIISEGDSAENIINIIRPDYYFKGPDYKNHKDDKTNKIKLEENLIKKFKGKVIYTSDIKLSSSKILNENLSSLNYEQTKIINYIKKKFSIKEIEEIINSFKNIKPLIIGETIVDQYVFCEALGKSGKDPFLAFREIYIEEYLGGVGLIARHLKGFCKKTLLLTSIGQKKEKVKFIRSNLSKNISVKFFCKDNSPTIVKKRFLDINSKSKLFGIYELNDKIIGSKEEKKLTNFFLKNNVNSDLSIVADYGHGFISKKISTIIRRKSKFLAANVQINAANKGYHSLYNYNKANFIIINESELRSEMRNRDENIKFLIKKLSKKLSLKFMAVTRGSKGIILFSSKDKSFFYCPAFEINPVDKIGAGDTMLSILSICIFKKIDLKLATFISSIAAALSVRSIGNKNSITKENLLKYISHTLS